MNLRVSNELAFPTMCNDQTFPKAHTLDNHYEKIERMLKREPNFRSKEETNNLMFFFQQYLLSIIFTDQNTQKYSDK
jgi:hypothetical protein